MPGRTDLNLRRTVLPRLWDFMAGAGTATLLVCLLLLLFREAVRRGISTAVFRYVGF